MLTYKYKTLTSLSNLKILLSYYTQSFVKKRLTWTRSCLRNRKQHNQNSSLSPARLQIFTCNVNFPVWRHYLECQRDVINVKNIYEILRYLLQILAMPLMTNSLLSCICIFVFLFVHFSLLSTVNQHSICEKSNL